MSPEANSRTLKKPNQGIRDLLQSYQSFIHGLKPFFQKTELRGLLGCLPILVCLFLSGCGLFNAQTTYAPKQAINCTGIVKTAYSQVGKKYRSGGDSPKKGFDCSGLVWWAYKQHGVTIPRITKDQAKTGRAVTKKAARPGDIVVFRSSGSRTGLHTGVYAGKDSFIHSPSKGKTVCLEKLSSPHWKNKLLCIRHVGK